MTVRPPRRVVALVLDRVGWLDLGAPTHLFGYCGPPLYEFGLAAVRPGRVRTSAGPDIVVDQGLEALLDAHTIVVPGCEDELATVPGEALDALRASAARGTRIISICTGAFTLAAAGLLDGRRATTHWASATELAQRFPAITVLPDQLYIDDGQILTSAGVAAGLDLCLHVIRTDHGAAVALEFARRTVIAPHREGGQAQYINLPSVQVQGTESLGATQDWARANLAGHLSIARLAAHAQLSSRTFLRRFRAQTGMTPAAWIAQERVLAARVLLETSTLSIDQVAHRTGLGTSEALRLQFRDKLHTTPTAYRRAFGS